MSSTFDLTITPSKILKLVLKDFPVYPREPVLADLNRREREIATKVTSMLLDFHETTVILDIEEEEELDFFPSEGVDEVSYEFENLELEGESSAQPRNTFTYEYVKKVMDWREEKKNASPSKKYPAASTIQKNFRRVVNPKSYLRRFKVYLEKMDTVCEKYQKVAEFVLERFTEARASGLQVHDRELRLWALQKADEIFLARENFRASPSWILSFKKKNNITSRKVTKFVSVRSQKKVEEIQVAAIEFQERMKDEIRPSFFDHEIFNLDQSGIQYELHSARTLSFRGEKSTEALAKNLNFLTHSYTIVPLLSMAGTLMSPLFLCLQEVSGRFGPIVLNSLRRLSNVYVTCSRSGKLDKEKVKLFFQHVVVENTAEKACLIIDAWPTQKDEKIYKYPGKLFRIEILPEGSTSFIQPLDVGFFRYWKGLIRRIVERIMIENLDIKIHDRNFIIKMNSVILNQFQAPTFKILWQAAWKNAGFDVLITVHYPSVNEICFDFEESNCKIESCNFSAFIKCAYDDCKLVMCVHCFILGDHLHNI